MQRTLTSVDLPLEPGELRRLLTDPRAARRWAGGSLEPVVGGPCRLTDQAGVDWVGQVIVVGADRPLKLRLSNPYAADGKATIYSLVVQPQTSAKKNAVGCKLVVSLESGGPAHAGAVGLWEAVGRRLTGMGREIRGRRVPKQAVVVIHGIGEQVPGRTLERFVRAVTATDEEPLRSASDQVSGSYELRQLTLSPNGARPRTMFYEYYWAHAVQGTTPGDLFGWIWSLMFRRPSSIPPQLRVIWAIFWLLAVALTLSVVSFGSGLSQIRYVSTLVTVGLAGGATIVVRYLGDAARYLSPRPRNVTIRHAIRQEGIGLLRQLHESGQYQRIILVGHSLGSVIAYDLIAHLWAEMHRETMSPESARFRAIAAAHRFDEDGDARPTQSKVWQEMRRNTQPWLITDLVSVGSPLAHGEYLLAGSGDEFREKCERGEIPVAPPAGINSDGRFAYNQSYTSRSGRPGRSFTYLNESAPFAAVRWTNLYVPAKLGFFGDLIGGPVSDSFGPWVHDVPLGLGLAWWRRFSLLSHTAYWRLGAGGRAGADPRLASHVTALRDALALDQLRKLRAQAAKHDPLMYCRVDD